MSCSLTGLMCRRIAFLLAAIVVPGPAATRAQETATLSPGRWVRATLFNRPIVGQLTVVENDRLTIRTGSTTRSMAMRDIERLEVRYWTGERLTLRGVGIGGAVGGLMGVVIGLVAGDHEGFAPLVIGISAAAGGGIGAIIGYASRKHRWRVVPLPESGLQLQAVPTPRAIAARVTIRL